MHRKSKKW